MTDVLDRCMFIFAISVERTLFSNREGHTMRGASIGRIYEVQYFLLNHIRLQQTFAKCSFACITVLSTLHFIITVHPVDFILPI